MLFIGSVKCNGRSCRTRTINNYSKDTEDVLSSQREIKKESQDIVKFASVQERINKEDEDGNEAFLMYYDYFFINKEEHEERHLIVMTMKQKIVECVEENIKLNRKRYKTMILSDIFRRMKEESLIKEMPSYKTFNRLFGNEIGGFGRTAYSNFIKQL